MSFRPKVNELITINSLGYRFTEHPSAPKMVYGQSGRRATVYQVQREDKSLHALKVFTVAWRDSRNAVSAGKLSTFSNLPGLQVCDRHVITPQSHPSLLSAYPDLEYAVLMAWVSGETWQEVIMNGHPFSPEQSQAVVRSFVDVLAWMEQAGLAHCDLSGPNVLIKTSPAKVELVDVEDIFGPGLDRPQKVGGGSSGYAHKTAPAGLWCEKADRFAGAVLLAEMLGWCDERVRRIAFGEQFFDPDEVQHGTERYQVLHQVLKERWGDDVADTFAQAWFSETLEECPPFQEWNLLLNSTEEQRQVQAKLARARLLISQGQLDLALKELEVAYSEHRLIVARVYTQALIMRGDRSFQAGKMEDALKDYRAAREATPVGDVTQSIDQAIRKVEKAIFLQDLENAEKLISQGQVETALAKLKELYLAEPGLAALPYCNAIFTRGRVKEGQGDLASAEQDFLAALVVAPGEPIKSELKNTLKSLKMQVGIQNLEAGERLLTEDKLEQAVQKLEEAYQTDPGRAANAYARALFTWGARKEREGNKEGALRDYHKAFQVAPEGGLKDEIKLSIDEVGEVKPPEPPDNKTKKPRIFKYFLLGGIFLFLLPLLCFLLFILFPGTPGNPPVQEETATAATILAPEGLELLAANGWTNTNIMINKGDLLTIQRSSGLWSPWPGGLFNADGDPNSDSNDPANIVQWQCNHGALIGHIGSRPGGSSSSSFCIGEKFSQYMDYSGYLYLSINDSVTTDDSGSITVRINVQDSPTGSSAQNTAVAQTPTKTAPTKTPTKASTSVPSKTPTKSSTPVPTCDSVNNCYEVEVSAKTMWLGTKVQVSKGDRIVLEYVSGKWRAGTGDQLIWTDANGYPGISPLEYCPWCTAPILEGTLGQLVAKITEQKAVHTIGNAGEFLAEANGILCLMMNDIYYSFDDNSGSVLVRIWVNP